MFRYLLRTFTSYDTSNIQLGRWSLKTCDDIKNVANIYYQNRDHCGDLICKEPSKYEDVIKTKDTLQITSHKNCPDL